MQHLEASLREMGMPEEKIAASKAAFEAREEEQGKRYGGEIYPENRQAYDVFLELADQWDFPGAFGGRLGVQLVNVESALRLVVRRESRRTPVYAQLKVMLRTARSVLHDRFEKARAKT